LFREVRIPRSKSDVFGAKLFEWEYRLPDAIGIAVIDSEIDQPLSKSCSICGRMRQANRQERGLYVCDECGLVANTDTNEAKSIRRKGTPEFSPRRSG
jgi:hypothetical protein